MKRLVSKVKRKVQPRVDIEPPPMQIGSPSDLILQVPRPRLDANGVPIQATDHEIDRETMRIALTYMSDYLASKGQTLTVIAVGGAVNILLLGSRLSTHDLDFMGTHLNNDQRVAIDEAAHFAERQCSKPLGSQWFNNETQMWLSPPVHRQITEQALQQNEIVFEKHGLRIVAAPWIYALASKTHRLARDRRAEQMARARPYDVTDAATYLRKYVQQNGGQAQSPASVQARCVEFGFRVDDVDLQTVNAEYRRLYRADGLVA
ncbi:unnamed protein product [Zymoseptoria tritici ST99CH_1E4]|uniref:DUF7582 domain-containing protein n=1 Tax=Zymoseptoria tritici ST99CH_1E4 TaxID=1276532 RepID=A0A2H1G684_ZYMTR|nr:unnamed protein product [Zymoseptoria tritici ST99CH_1E4]